MKRFIPLLGILGAVIAVSGIVADVYLSLTRQMQTLYATTVTDFPFPSVGDFEWSPDRTQVVFRRGLAVPFGGVGNGALYSMNADGSDLHSLPGTDILITGANWSPNGQRLAFVWGEPRFGKRDVYVMNADGSQRRRVAQGDRFVGKPIWSPDGKHLAFRLSRDAADSRLYSVQVENGTPQLLSTGVDPYSDAPYSWSPDSKKIAFVADRDGDDDIFVIDIGKGQVQTITHNDADDSFPAWSPSGKQLAFVSEQGPITPYVIGIDGSNLTQVTDNKVGGWMPVWSPDGQQIAFVGLSERPESRYGIYITDPKGEQARRVKSEEWPITDITWLGLADQLAYASDTETFDYKYLNRIDLNTGLTYRIYPPVILGNLVCPQQIIANHSENISIAISNSLPIPIQVPIVLDIQYEPFIVGPKLNLHPSATSQKRTIELISHESNVVSWPISVNGDHAYISVFVGSGEFPMSEKRCDITVDKEVEIFGFHIATLQRFLQGCVLLGVVFMVPWLYQHRSRTVLIIITVILFALYLIASESLM